VMRMMVGWLRLEERAYGGGAPPFRVVGGILQNLMSNVSEYI
jgi:hypothetical protein